MTVRGNGVPPKTFSGSVTELEKLTTVTAEYVYAKSQPGSPFLTHVTLREDRVQPGVHPFTVPWLLPSLDLQLSAPVTFLVGENGTGKSTLLEAIAWSVGFGAQGGNRDHSFAENADGHALGRALRLSWRQKVLLAKNSTNDLLSRPRRRY
jgi:hypothetical protein